MHAPGHCACVQMTPAQQGALNNLSSVLRTRTNRNTSICDTPVSQVYALCALFLLFDGDSWTNSSGWDSKGCWNLLDTWQLGRPQLPNVTKGMCVEQVADVLPDNATQAGFVEVWEQQREGTMAYRNVTLPDFCCWLGIKCCSVQQCRNQLDVPMTCNCKSTEACRVRLLFALLPAVQGHQRALMAQHTPSATVRLSLTPPRCCH